MKAYIDKRKCPAYYDMCKPIKECPANALKWIADDKEKFRARIEVAKEKCTGCGACIPLFCGNCIELR